MVVAYLEKVKSSSAAAGWMCLRKRSSALENVTGSFQLGFRESSVNTSSCNSRLDVTLAGRGVGKKVSSCTRSKRNPNASSFSKE
ncbi:hypothetical protein PsorP6_013448 [Peronosclerospora sorghi]|uniref:Uncharacterized protein n=1 Tax=Peronosclerospora sorghi TaxID=230839 RepID=A0ACC0VGP1_9STRA|nr:hypothetical protein PsorP6_013448 [Peronosclerospora sorghi]